MAEPFSDEELTKGITWGPTQGLDVLAQTAERIGATVNRLREERDEARRVAKVLATCLENDPPPHLSAGEHAAFCTAIAYPEVP